LKYDVKPGDGKSVKVHLQITQSEVDAGFAMFVPVYADFGEGMRRIGQVPIVGNSTRSVVYSMDGNPKRWR